MKKLTRFLLKGASLFTPLVVVIFFIIVGKAEIKYFDFGTFSDISRITILIVWAISLGFYMLCINIYDESDIDNLLIKVLMVLTAFMSFLFSSLLTYDILTWESTSTTTFNFMILFIGLTTQLSTGLVVFWSIIARWQDFWDDYPDSKFKSIYVPLMIVGGSLVLSSLLALIFKGASLGAQKGLVSFGIVISGLTILGTLGTFLFKILFLGRHFSGHSSGSYGGSGGGSNNGNIRDVVGMSASYNIGCTVKVTITGISNVGNAMYLTISKNVTHAWHENENEEKAYRLALKQLLSDANRKLKRINSDFYIANNF